MENNNTNVYIVEDESIISHLYPAAIAAMLREGNSDDFNLITINLQEGVNYQMLTRYIQNGLSCLMAIIQFGHASVFQ